MFWDLPSAWPVWLFGAVSMRKITVHTGQRLAKREENGTLLVIKEKKRVFGVVFGIRVGKGTGNLPR